MIIKIKKLKVVMMMIITMIKIIISITLKY